MKDNELVDKFFNSLNSTLASDVKKKMVNKTLYAMSKAPYDNVFENIDYEYVEVEPVEFSMDDADLDGVMQSKGQLVYGDRVLFLYRQYQYFDFKNADHDINDIHYMPNPYYHLCKCTHLKEIVPQSSVHKYFTYTDRHTGAFQCVVYDNVTCPGHSFKRNKVAYLKVCPSCFRDLHLAKRGYDKDNFDLSRYHKEESLKLYKRKNAFTKKDEEALRAHDYSVIGQKNAEFLKIKYNNCCSVCGKHDDHLQIHHIDKNPMNNTIENLALVCDKCHDKYHPHRKDIINNKK